MFAGAVMERLMESGKFGVEEDSSIAAKYMYMSGRDHYLGLLKAAPRRKRIEQLKLLARREVLSNTGSKQRHPGLAEW